MLSLYLISPQSLHVESAKPGARLRVVDGEAHHIARVARHRVGERIWISNGEGLRATSLIEEITRDGVEILIEEVEFTERAVPTLSVIQALTKSDRAHECVELLVAGGVDEIIPWSADRSIGKWDEKNSAAKWREWIKAGVKQTRRTWMPHLGVHSNSLAALIDSNRGINSQTSSQLIIALHEEGSVNLDRDLFEVFQGKISGASKVTLIIGPEGGLSERELEFLDGLGIARVRLGTPIFRSAHAGVIALTALQASFALWR